MRSARAPESASCASVSNAVDELGELEQVAEAGEEGRFERPDGELPAVGGRVDPVTGKPAGQELGEWLPSETVGDEAVSAVCQRYDDVRAPAGPLASEQRGKDAGHGGERAACQISDLHRRHRRRRVG